MGKFKYNHVRMCFLYGYVLLFISLLAYLFHDFETPGLTVGFMVSGFIFIAVAIFIEAIRDLLQKK